MTGRAFRLIQGDVLDKNIAYLQLNLMVMSVQGTINIYQFMFVLHQEVILHDIFLNDIRI